VTQPVVHPESNYLPLPYSRLTTGHFLFRLLTLAPRVTFRIRVEAWRVRAFARGKVFPLALRGDRTGSDFPENTRLSTAHVSPSKQQTEGPVPACSESETSSSDDFLPVKFVL
jgi:hypothetical protein